MLPGSSCIDCTYPESGLMAETTNPTMGCAESVSLLTHSSNMFYTTLLFNKRGVLSKIWIAAHWEKKLTKANIFECNLDSAIQNIMSTKLHIALRTSGHLLLGVVRIYNRKVKYLLADCNEAFVKMKMSFRPGALDLTEDKRMASYKTITLPEVFHEFDSPLPDIDCTDDHFMLNRSRPEDITLPENYGERVEGLRCDSLFDVSTNSFQPENLSASAGQEESGLFTQDCFGDEGLIHTFFDDNPMNAVDSGLIEGIPELDSEIFFPPCTSEQGHETDVEVDLEISESEKIKPTDHYTTLAIEEDAFVLEPVDITELQKRKKGKKRILKVDRVTQISSSAMRKQILDFSDTLTTIYMAPQTRQMMNWKIMGGVDWLLSNPCQTIIDGNLLMMFKHCLSINFKKSTWEERSEPEFEIMRAEQVIDSTNMLQLEEPSHLHESRLGDISISDIDEMFQIDNDAGQNEKPGSESIDPSVSLDPIPIFPDTEHHMSEDNAQSSDEQGRDNRTQDLLMVLRNLNRAGMPSFSFQKITKNNGRKEASVTFYSLLMLENQSAIELRQSEPYSDIIATPGPAFYSL
uniref:RAD21 cohesin complex component like 1 n=1 Tax=Leptobrachium leishanense TaxID=445787 RepID=A0A8C5MK05_9ANUR